MHALTLFANKKPTSSSKIYIIHCCFFAMDFNTWWNSGGTSFKSSLKYVKNGYERIVSCDIVVSGSKISRWRILWRKFKKEKKKLFNRSSSLGHVPSYDPYTYSQNFDHGSMWTDPDNHCRSFSARFAVPSRIFQKRELIGWWEIWGRKWKVWGFFFFFLNIVIINVYI